MNYFRDSSALSEVLTAIYTENSKKLRQTALANVLKDWGWTNQQASLFASTVFKENVKGSPDRVTSNIEKIVGAWMRCGQQGSAASLLETMTDRWEFNSDLTYKHKIEKYDGYISPQFSYSRPRSSAEQGIWVASDSINDKIDLFVMSFTDFAHQITFEGIDVTLTDSKGRILPNNSRYNACFIQTDRFERSNRPL